MGAFGGSDASPGIVSVGDKKFAGWSGWMVRIKSRAANVRNWRMKSCAARRKATRLDIGDGIRPRL